MSSSLIQVLIVYPTVFFAGLSVPCNIYVARSTLRSKRDLIQQHGPRIKTAHDFIIWHLIFSMAIIDTFYAFGTIVIFGINWPNVTSYGCYIAGFVSQFLAVCSSLWRLLIPCYLFYLLTASVRTQTAIAKKKDFVESIFESVALVIVFLSLVGAILPLVWTKHKVYYGILYAYKDGGNYYGAECWTEGYFQLIYYTILMLSVVFDMITLILAYYKYRETKAYTNAYWVLIKRLFAWVFVFLIIRLVPFFDRVLILFIKNFNPPLWLVLCHNYFIGATGIANAIVWYLTQRITPPSTQKSSLNSAEQVGVQANYDLQNRLLENENDDIDRESNSNSNSDSASDGNKTMDHLKLDPTAQVELPSQWTITDVTVMNEKSTQNDINSELNVV